jgi:carbon starvation protein
MLWLLITTLWAGFEKLFSSDTHIGFIAQAHLYSAQLASGATAFGKAHNVDQMHQIISNAYTNATLCGIFMLIVIMMILVSIKPVVAALKSKTPTAKETEAVIVA